MSESEKIYPRDVEGVQDWANEFYHEISQMRAQGYGRLDLPDQMGLEDVRARYESQGYEFVVKELPDPSNPSERILKPTIFIKKK